MASAWGNSWGNAWGNSWGAVIFTPPVTLTPPLGIVLESGETHFIADRVESDIELRAGETFIVLVRE